MLKDKLKHAGNTYYFRLPLAIKKCEIYLLSDSGKFKYVFTVTRDHQGMCSFSIDDKVIDPMRYKYLFDGKSVYYKKV